MRCSDATTEGHPFRCVAEKIKARLWIQKHKSPIQNSNITVLPCPRSFGGPRKRQLMPIRIEHVEIPFAPRSILWLFRLESQLVEASPDRVHIRDMEDEPTPAVNRLTLLQIENGRLCLPCAK